MLAVIIHELISADDVTFGNYIPVIGVAVYARNLIGGKLKNLKHFIRAVERAGVLAIQKNAHADANQQHGAQENAVHCGDSPMFARRSQFWNLLYSAKAQ